MLDKDSSDDEDDYRRNKKRRKGRRPINRSTTDDPTFTSAAMTTATTMPVTDSAVVSTRSIRATEQKRPMPRLSPLHTSLTTLAVVVGVLAVIIIALAVFLFWRKRRRPGTNSSMDKHDTYHMYSEIDHTTIILSDERADDTQGFSYRDKVVRPPPPPVPNHDYDELTFKRESQVNSNYSKLDQKQINMKDPRLSNYDSTAPIIKNGTSANHPNGSVRNMAPSSPEKLQKEKSENTDHVPCEPVSEGPNYFQLEKNFSGEDIQNTSNDGEKQEPAIPLEIDNAAEGEANYFLVEKDGTDDTDAEKEE